MKLSKVLHIASVIVGLVGIGTFIGSILGGSDNLVFGITKADSLFCTAILILIAIWLQTATIHHVIIEKHGEIL